MVYRLNFLTALAWTLGSSNLPSGFMKLYNKTKCPDSILKPLIVAAGKSVGVKTGKVVVKVTQGRYGQSYKGMAHADSLVYTWHLWGRKRKGRKYRTSLIATDGGWFEITLPGNEHHCFVGGLPPHISNARNFYKTVQHEWSHIKDYQDGTYERSPRTPNGRRIDWASRPCELAAMRSVKEAKDIQGIDDIILALAIYFESCVQG